MIYKTNKHGKLLASYQDANFAAKNNDTTACSIRRAIRTNALLAGKYYFSKVRPKGVFIKESKNAPLVGNYTILEKYRNNLIIFVNEKLTSGENTHFTDQHRVKLNNEIYNITKLLCS